MTMATKQSVKVSAVMLLSSSFYVSYLAIRHAYPLLFCLVATNIFFIGAIFMYQRRLEQKPFDPPSIVLENNRDAN
jgi:hypothetical protein